jgi:anti-sigma regulatory factor (Ser/Thr protein kinase)
MGADGLRPSEMEFELPPEPTSVTRARHAISAVARRVGAPEDDVALAVSEAVGNAVVHAFRDRSEGTITISAHPSGDELVVTVSDDGSGMAPDMEGRGLGVGITLIARLASDMRLESSERGTTVSMSFELGSQAGHEGELRVGKRA